jgi:predicted DsbA family dithiol-disulfide isomerase
MARTLHLDVVIDVVCPWCFLGKRRLDAAIRAVPEIGFTVRYRPFQLDPTLPPEGKDRARYLLDKFRDPARIAAAHDRLAELGKAEGIDFAFDAIRLAPNTLDAHRVIHWATEAGHGEAAVERLFSLYFEDGADLTRPETLADAAAAAGLDRGAVLADLAGPRDRSAVEAEIALATRVGITGVPCTIVASKYAISGAQEADAMADAFRRIAAEAD